MSIFSNISFKRKPSTVFDLSHSIKTTSEIGRMAVTLCEPTIPGDSWRVNSETFIRLAPTLAPVMHMINVYQHFFRVDSFTLWDGFKTFITGGKSGNESPEYPRVTVHRDLVQKSIDNNENLFGPSSLWDYLGFPILESNGNNLISIPKPGVQSPVFYFDALPFLAYYKVWSIYYADENIFEFPYDDDYKLPDGIMSAEDSYTYLKNCCVRYRCYEKDYFTSSLPWPQRGDSVRIPSEGSLVSGQISYHSDSTQRDYIYFSGNNGTKPEGQALVNSQFIGGSSGNVSLGIGTDQGILPASIDNSKHLALSDSTVTVNSATINELRRSFAAQAWQETNARAGWRLPEFIKAHYGVRNSDYRYFYPHYLGGGKAPVAIGEVMQTSQSTTQGDSPSPLGAMAGRGVSAGRSNTFVHHFNDYGYIIGILTVIPRSEYQGGLPRKYQKFDRFDYAFPEFAHLGEQEVKNSELYFNTSSPNKNDGVFGYQSRYAEYKFINSSTHGDFLSSLNYWHLGRQFNDTPGLNQEFLEVRPEDNNRIFAVEREVNGKPLDHLWAQIYFNITAKRLLPKYGTPSQLI